MADAAKTRQFFADMRAESPANQLCADCGLTNASLICIDCSGTHRSLGVHLSFVRSVTMDSWSDRQLRLMKAGGNARLLEFMEAQRFPPGLTIRQKYSAEAMVRYREYLQALADGKESCPPVPFIGYSGPVGEDQDDDSFGRRSEFEASNFYSGGGNARRSPQQHQHPPHKQQQHAQSQYGQQQHQPQQQRGFGGSNDSNGANGSGGRRVMESYGSDGLTPEERRRRDAESGNGRQQAGDDGGLLADLGAGLASAWSWGRQAAVEVGSVVAVKSKQAAIAVQAKSAELSRSDAAVSAKRNVSQGWSALSEWVGSTVDSLGRQVSAIQDEEHRPDSGREDEASLMAQRNPGLHSRIPESPASSRTQTRSGSFALASGSNGGILGNHSSSSSAGAGGSSGSGGRMANSAAADGLGPAAYRTEERRSVPMDPIVASDSAAATRGHSQQPQHQQQPAGPQHQKEASSPGAPVVRVVLSPSRAPSPRSQTSVSSKAGDDSFDDFFADFMDDVVPPPQQQQQQQSQQPKAAQPTKPRAQLQPRLQAAKSPAPAPARVSADHWDHFGEERAAAPAHHKVVVAAASSPKAKSPAGAASKNQSPPRRRALLDLDAAAAVWDDDDVWLADLNLDDPPAAGRR